MKKIELLAPAGNLEKLKYAIAYGADAVYAGVPDFSLRVRINNFTQESLKEAVEYVHQHKKKIFVTLNIYAHNVHLDEIKSHLKFLKTLDIDGVIVADPGIIMLVKKYLPKVEIHLSTQANATNIEAVKFWAKNGVKRIVLAREVSLDEIREIKKAVPKMELEYFIHGAMCMSYSGRCILSKWMSNRSANLGDCTQPCRWKYTEVKSPKSKVESEILEKTVVDDMGRFEVDLEEDRHGTYFFNSRDMNLSAHIQDLIDAGIDSLKIEGRAKSVYYVATVVRAYRKIIDALKKKNLTQVIKEQQKELDTLVNRGYSKGFLLGNEPEHNFEGALSETDYKFAAQIEGKKKINGQVLNVVFMHNEIFLKDKIEAISPKGNEKVKIKKILNYKLEKVTEAHGGHDKRFFVQFDKILAGKTLLRRKLTK
ncbi:MAG: U32 family peptidase [Candidatus Moranbacteria bacterium]|nr:U32 family peptidase [Candidatus Moranbacteria bacterium]